MTGQARTINQRAGQPYDHDDGDPDVTTETPHQPNPPFAFPMQTGKTRAPSRARSFSQSAMVYCNIICDGPPALVCARDLFLGGQRC